MTVREFCLSAMRRRKLRFRLWLAWSLYYVFVWLPLFVGTYHYYGGFDGAPPWIAVPAHTTAAALLLVPLVVGIVWLRKWARRNGLACPSCKRAVGRNDMKVLTGTGACPYCGFQLLEDHIRAPGPDGSNAAAPSEAEGRSEE